MRLFYHYDLRFMLNCVFFSFCLFFSLFCIKSTHTHKTNAQKIHTHTHAYAITLTAPGSASATASNAPDLSLSFGKAPPRGTSAPASPAKSRESLLQRVQSLTGAARDQGASIIGIETKLTKGENYNENNPVCSCRSCCIERNSANV